VRFELQKQGFDPAIISDSLYVRDAPSGHYVALTPALYRDICDGKVKL